MPGAVRQHPPALPPTREASSMGTIPLPCGRVTVVDDADQEALSRHRWYFDKGYVVRFDPSVSAKGRRRILMHREIVGALPGELVDHQDRDTLNNQRSNLRRCERTENNMNRGKQAEYGGRPVGSRFKGVYRDRARGAWCADIAAGGKRVRLGRFATEEEAALAYDRAAVEMHGEFAVTNLGTDSSTHERAEPTPDSPVGFGLSPMPELRTLREAAGLSRERLAKAAGIGSATVKRIEGGARTRLSIRRRLLEVLDRGPGGAE